ncbi:MAG: helix-turn-helix transcriptional regulator [Phycisphaeraceae bacterium]|nr:MAG: helix-turn-helix transcriptional regulator [Phycisphaeraceae bacterium]
MNPPPAAVRSAESAARPDQGTGNAAVLVRFVEQACALPAVATVDWASRAASIVARLSPLSRTWAMFAVCEIAPDGKVDSVETVGSAWSDSPTSPSDAQARDAFVDQFIEVRRLGFAPDPAAAPAVSDLSTFTRSTDWASTGLGRLVTQNRCGMPVIAAMAMSSEGRRFALSAIAPPQGSALEPSVIGLLKAAFPSLVRRARLAVGEQPLPRPMWVSERERAVLDGLVLGKSVRQIAEDLGRSPHTVHDHVKSLHRKLNASSRGELIARALGHLTRATRIRSKDHV